MDQLQQSKGAVSILIVEDDLAARDLISRMVAMQFPEAVIYTAEDGAAGLELYKWHAPRIVITDIGMPGINGIELARAIRSIDQGTKLIVLTAYSDKLFAELCREIGLHAYLLKPLNLDKLMDAIRECVLNQG